MILRRIDDGITRLAMHQVPLRARDSETCDGGTNTDVTTAGALISTISSMVPMTHRKRNRM